MSGVDETRSDQPSTTDDVIDEEVIDAESKGRENVAIGESSDGKSTDDAIDEVRDVESKEKKNVEIGESAEGKTAEDIIDDAIDDVIDVVRDYPPSSQPSVSSSVESLSDLSKSIDLDFDPPKRPPRLRLDTDLEVDLSPPTQQAPSFSLDDSPPQRPTPPPTNERAHEIKEESLLFDEDRVPSPQSPFFRRHTAPLHLPQRSDDSNCGTALSGSVVSFRHRFSQFSIDNSCFDLLAMSGENSAVGTPVEKVFPKDMYSSILLEKVAKLEKAINDQKDELATTSREAKEDEVVFPRVGSLKRKDTAGKRTESVVPLKEAALSHEAETSSGKKAVFSDSSSTSSEEVVMPRKASAVAAVPLRLTESIQNSPPGSPVVRQKGGRLSIRAVRRHNNENETPRTTTDSLISHLGLPPRPPRLDLVVGGPGCVAAPYPPTPSPRMELPSSLPEVAPPTEMAPPVPSDDKDKENQMSIKKEDRGSRKAVGRRFGNLRIIEILRVRILHVKGIRGQASKPLFIVAKLDHRDIHQSAGVLRDSCDPVIEEFCHEGFSSFSNLHIVILEGSRAPGKAPRPIGRVSLKRKELVRQSGREVTLPLRVVSKCQEVQGQICLDIRREQGKFALRVVDYSGLGLRDSQELYLLVSSETTKESRKLRIHSGRFSEEWLAMPCRDGVLSLKMTLWHDMLRGLNSVFHGQVRVDVDERWTNGPSKWFYLRPRHGENDKETKNKGKENRNDDGLGEVRMWMSYTADHVMPPDTYRPLMTALSASLAVKPFSASLVALLENLPQVDLGVLARPLVQALACSKDLRPLLNALYKSEIDRCQDLNTLFRSQSLASKMLYELLKIYGHSYLLVTLKPVIDKIYKERKCCEIDPSRLPQGEMLEKNTTNLLSYFSLAFSRVVESAARCPAPLKSILYDLRMTVAESTGRPEVERLALSSFLIMRFFAAAILNPKSFGLKRDQPEPRVARTLVLLSKMLQRLANCCVSEQPLISKEPWLSPVLLRVTDTVHRAAMVRYLDRVSLHCPEPSLSTESIAVLKEGYLLETRSRVRPSWRKMLHQKKRYVMLTDTDLMWQKSHRGELNPKGTISLTDIQSMAVENRNIVVLRMEKDEMAFEAASAIEASEWLTQIERQRNRARRLSSRAELTELADCDAEREMEALHILLVEHADTLTVWKRCIESGSTVPPGTAPVPPALEGIHMEPGQREVHRAALLSTLDEALSVTYTIETAHRDAVAVYMNTMNQGSGTKDNPIGDDNYLLLKRKLNLN